MKIVDVKTYSAVYPVKQPFSNAMRTTRERAFGIVVAGTILTGTAARVAKHCPTLSARPPCESGRFALSPVLVARW